MLLSFTIRFCDKEPSVDDNETKILKKTFGKEIHFGMASPLELDRVHFFPYKPNPMTSF